MITGSTLFSYNTNETLNNLNSKCAEVYDALEKAFEDKLERTTPDGEELTDEASDTIDLAVNYKFKAQEALELVQMYAEKMEFV